jgi:hypothetical protein
VRRSTRASLAGLSGPLLGTALGVIVVFTSSRRDEPLFLAWAPLAVALGAVAGAVFVYGVRRWPDLVAVHPVRVRDVAAPILAIAAIGLALINVTAFLPGTAHGNGRLGWLVSFATLAGAPAGGVMYGVRRAASSQSQSQTAGGRLLALVALRRLLQRLLAAVGALVALATLQTGARLALEQSVHSTYGNRPPEYVLIFGGVGSMLVALAYVPGWAALRDRGQQLCDELLPMDRLEAPSAILSVGRERRDLEQILGTDKSVLADMQTGLAILAPLLAGAAAAFLPH